MTDTNIKELFTFIISFDIFGCQSEIDTAKHKSWEVNQIAFFHVACCHKCHAARALKQQGRRKYSTDLRMEKVRAKNHKISCHEMKNRSNQPRQGRKTFTRIRRSKSASVHTHTHTSCLLVIHWPESVHRKVHLHSCTAVNTHAIIGYYKKPPIISGLEVTVTIRDPDSPTETFLLMFIQLEHFTPP